MEKKLYNSPLIEVMNVSTELMQHLTPESQTEMPDGPAGAPAKNKPVF